ncbi:tRNA (5-methylaminomethyl-2-thiouridine)(34)-methyltransferase MnmD [Flavobacterium sp.]|uniref:tRNA (5-methylaminomethyl-2-thiouridine)(34)-methyltransferase MnmD n=1 Tax=Flavobacterium sp. TaxID=239 RepID=UPI0025E71C47|nr:tRNA (5-methylaminomethyl-2-thiouridine)(34)-methyltransferase MnmD [Flavobacterium sp.]
MKREIIQTKDGSTTIYLPDWEESYHSKYGAIQEAYHVFIKNGFSLFQGKPITILEIGFGTGLNAFITCLEAKKTLQKVHYVGVEAYPVALSEALKMNYAEEISPDSIQIYEKLHQTEWEVSHAINNYFSLTKRKQFFQEIEDRESFDLIYFDAFGFRVQPELWGESIFAKMYQALKPKGVLVTYACRTSIKRAMLAAGFEVEKLPGAPGKREMLRAFKEA